MHITYICAYIHGYVLHTHLFRLVFYFLLYAMDTYTYVYMCMIAIQR